MRKLLRAFFFFSRTERRGLIVWTVLILLIILAGEIYSYRQSQLISTHETQEAHERAVKEYQAFAASVRRREEREKPTWQRLPHQSQKESVFKPVLFDPNTADSVTFRQLGLPGWMARNILRYREKGGKFYRAEDFRKIYGLTEEQYQILEPYIHITPTDAVPPRPSLFLTETSTDSLPQQKSEKYATGTQIELNRADTTELKKIPGIGSAIARLICSYRQRLGGFYHIKQLREINLNDSKLDEWFTIDTTALTRIPINHVGVRRLLRHPYINFYQAKALVEYRKKHGPLKNLKPFGLYEEFTPEDLERLTHYLDFE